MSQLKYYLVNSGQKEPSLLSQERKQIMPRPARKQSESGYQHVIVRGIGRQLLFEDANDYRYYLWLLEKYSGETGVTVCAYCLMNNHVHLLLFDMEAQVSLFMKKMGISYTAYFNRNYERVGHLFQDRFKSEPIENEPYLLSVFRYILRNPEKAGICSAFEYPWSSVSLYGKDSFADVSFLTGKFASFEDYREFINMGDGEPCMEADPAETKDEAAK